MSRIAVVFDMDDTLYEEREYVLSGFGAVADYLQALGARAAFNPLDFMVQQLDSEGRGRIFNDLAEAMGLSEVKPQELVQVYRRHTPKIVLNQHARGAITNASDYSGLPIHVITDGHRIVQRKKANALGLNKLVQRVWFTRDFGIRAEKPSTVVFQHMVNQLGIEPRNFIYVGDDPTKDFVGPRALGALSVRVRTGRMKDVVPESGFESDFEIGSLEELQGILLAID